jgi:hypothetical protein
MSIGMLLMPASSESLLAHAMWLASVSLVLFDVTVLVYDLVLV